MPATASSSDKNTPNTEKSPAAKTASAPPTDRNADSDQVLSQGGQEQLEVDAGLVISPAGTPKPIVPDAPEELGKPRKLGEVVDPRIGSDKVSDFPGLKGQLGFDGDNVAAGTVPLVDPNRIPADVTTAVMPDAGNDRLLASAQAKAPSLTREFVNAMGLSDADLGAIARGEVPPPPTPGPIHTADMYVTPGGFVQTPPGITPSEADPEFRRFAR